MSLGGQKQDSEVNVKTAAGCVKIMHKSTIPPLKEESGRLLFNFICLLSGQNMF